MWKLMNYFFGWDYVLATNTATQRVCRVKIAPSGQRYFQPYSFQINMLDGPIKQEGEVVKGWFVQPLTKGAIDKQRILV